MAFSYTKQFSKIFLALTQPVNWISQIIVVQGRKKYENIQLVIVIIIISIIVRIGRNLKYIGISGFTLALLVNNIIRIKDCGSEMCYIFINIFPLTYRLSLKDSVERKICQTWTSANFLSLII